MEQAWAEMKRNISLANRVNKTDEEVATFQVELKEALHSAVTRCRLERKRKRAEAPQIGIGNESMLHAARFTDSLPLANYAQILHLVPRLVNVVTVSSCTQTLPYPQPPVASLTFVLPITQLAEAVPVPGSGLTLPLDLHAIGSRCTNAYYAPKRFAAVQLAFSNPRCRVLVFREPRASSNRVSIAMC